MALELYGRTWPEGYNALHVELRMFREDSIKIGVPPEQRPFHFKNIVRMFWGPKSKKPYVWDPWTDKMLINSCQEKYLWLSGCASSRKTGFASIWGIINWLADPANTLVLLTSTSLEDARRRIWGEVESFFMAANESLKSASKQAALLPGRLLGATGKIRTQDGGQNFGDKCGIQLIAGDRTKEKENIAKLIGLKNKRVFLLADELPELSPSLVEAAKSNLMTNPFFQMMGLGNFASIYDPFGVCAEPIEGWASVNPDMDEWRTKDGLCLRFDGMRSPNILAGEDKYPGQYGASHLRQHKEVFGEHSALFWRMCRSFPCPEADADRIYSDADMVKGDVRGVVRWTDMPVKVASLDPAFATGGDRAIATVGLLGLSHENRQTLQVTKQVELREDVRIKDQNRSVQVVRAFLKLCADEGVKPENRAIDISGGGLPFGALMSELSDNKFLGVQFGGSPSQRAASAKDRRPAKEAFSNRVAEIWFAGVDFVQGGQIKGLSNQVCVELTERRRLPAIKSASGVKLRIEQKSDMKKRTGGRSCDYGDSFLILLELCRERLNFREVGMQQQRQNPINSFKQRVAAINRVYRNVSYQPEEVNV